MLIYPRRVATFRPPLASPARRAAARPRITVAPPSVRSFAVSVEAGGYYRVSDPAVEGYELFRGVGGATPDFAAPPWQTFASLPFVTPALDPDETYTFVLRRRNRWGLSTENVEPTSLSINGGGDLNPDPPIAPSPVNATPAAGGTVRVTAVYPFALDADPADRWLIYLTTDGSAPDPAPGTPIVQEIRNGDGLAFLDYVTAAQTEGTIVKAIVRVRRTAPAGSGSPNVDSTHTDVVTATATLLGPPAPTVPAGFYGVAAKQA